MLGASALSTFYLSKLNAHLRNKGGTGPNKLFFPVFQATQENDFGITLADVLPTLTGERE